MGAARRFGWSVRSGPTSSGCSARLLNRLKWCSGGDR